MFAPFLLSRLLRAEKHQLDKLARLDAQLRVAIPDDRPGVQSQINDVMYEVGRLNKAIRDHRAEVGRRATNRKNPELIIGHEPDGTPSKAVCSSCGERMPEPNPPFPKPEDTIAAFSVEFRLHVRAKHPAFIPS